MRQQKRAVLSAALAAWAVMVLGADARAQLDSSDIQILAEQGQAEGWTFEVGRNSVTGKPLEAICNLQEPADWQASARFNPMLPPETGQLALPLTWDWRALNGCTPIKDQAMCGSCWAFATAGAMESALAIYHGLVKDLSEQYLVSCNNNGWDCGGGWFAHAYHYNTAGKDGGGIGAVLESAKPYTATDQACGGPFAHPYVIDSWAYVGGGGGVPSTAAIKQAILTYGPVSAAVCASSAFQAYHSGVFNACSSGTVNHAIVLVGWNDSEQAWILRNSWGTGWGESGYMRIRYGCCSVGYAACYVDYGADNPCPAFTSPAPGSTLSGASATFTWDENSDATEYWLNVGTAANKSDVYCKTQGTNLSVAVDKLPTNGKTLYVKLFAKIDGAWYGRSATYTAASVPSAAAAITSPAGGATLDAGPVTFQWSQGSGVSEYKLWIGTAAGTSNLYLASQGLNLSVTIANLPTSGKTLYVRLWSKVGTVWLKNDYTYTAASATPEAARITSPAGGSTLDSSSATFTWDEGLGATEYWFNVGTAAGKKDLVDRLMGKTRTVTINGLPTDGRTLYVRLWSKCNGTWQYNDYTYVTPNLTRGAAEMTSPAGGSTLDSQAATFAWSAGVGVTEYVLMIGTAAGGGNVYNKSQGMNTSVTVAGLPTNGLPVYVRLCSRIAGVMQKRDYVYTAATLTPAAAVLISPAPNALLTSSLVTFTWSTGTAVAEYKLSIGTTLGGTNLYNHSLGTNMSATVPNLPIGGQTIYVRLWSRIGATWQKKDYTFRASLTSTSPAAEITSPPADSTLTSSSVTLAWSTGEGATEYWLSVGSSPSGKDLFDRSLGTGRSATVAGLPTDGRTIYVRLSTKCSGVWQYRDYTYKAKGP